MALLKVLKAPHPILKKKAVAVEDSEFGFKLEEFMNSMLDTMYEENGIGLAAPQVGDSRRILVAEPRFGDEDASDVPLFMMVNPEITRRSVEMVGWEEGCLSLPDFLFNVPRHKTINVTWRTPNGDTISKTISDFHAIVIQHEIDHLDGITLLERASRPHRRKWLLQQKKRRRKFRT